MVEKLLRILNVLICIVFVVQLTGCGTLLYPERKGQRAGRVDAGVAILDGVGLLLFIIPGVIAFAVDFNNGTIYLPGTSRASLDNHNMKLVYFDPKSSSNVSIERIIKDQTGKEVRLSQDNMKITKLHSAQQIVFKEITS